MELWLSSPGPSPVLEKFVSRLNGRLGAGLGTSGRHLVVVLVVLVVVVVVVPKHRLRVKNLPKTHEQICLKRRERKVNCNLLSKSYSHKS